MPIKLFGATNGSSTISAPDTGADTVLLAPTISGTLVTLEEIAVDGAIVTKTSPTGSVITPKGTTAQRDAVPSSGYIRFNTETSSFELYDGTSWSTVTSETSPSGSVISPKGTTAQRDAVPSSGYIRFNTEEVAFEGYDGTEWKGIGGGLKWAVKTAAYTVSDADGVLLDTSLAAVTITATLNPDVGIQFAVSDFAGTFHTNNGTIARNGQLIMGLAEDLILSDMNQGITLVFAGGLVGWKVVDATPYSTVGGMNSDSYVGGVDYTAGTTTQLTTSDPILSEEQCFIEFDGVGQHSTEYSVNGSVVTFNEAIPLGVLNIQIRTFNIMGIGDIIDGTVTPEKLSFLTVHPISIIMGQY